MSKKFNDLVTEALTVEKELRTLSADRPSLRCYIAACLERSGEAYTEVEAIKERMSDEMTFRHSGCGAYVREVERVIASGKLPEPPEKGRISVLYWNQKDEAILELGGEPERLFLLHVVAAERASAEHPEAFGAIENIEARRARITELEGRRRELHQRIPTSWTMDDVVLGPIAADSAALVLWKMAPDTPVCKGAPAEPLIAALLEQTTQEAEAA